MYPFYKTLNNIIIGREWDDLYKRVAGGHEVHGTEPNRGRATGSCHGGQYLFEIQAVL